MKEKLISILVNQRNAEIPSEILEDEIKNGSIIIVHGTEIKENCRVADLLFESMENYVTVNVENAGYNKSDKKDKDTILVYVKSNGIDPYIECIYKFGKKGLRTICLYRNGAYHDFREIRKKYPQKKSA